MRHRALGFRGVSLYELLIVAAMIAVIAGITIPIFSLAVSRARARGVGEMLGAAIRDARTRAVSTGWNYRVIAFNAGGTVPNAFRIEGYDPSVLPPLSYPTATIPPASYGPTQVYEPFVNLAQEFGVGAAQIGIPGGGNTFFVAFDRNGQWPAAEPCVPPGNCQVQVVSGGRTVIITVSAAGAVRIAK